MFLPSDFFSEFEQKLIEDCKESKRCVYCGSSKQVRDHFIPHSYICSSGQRHYKDKDNLVPACEECNSIKSDKLFETISEAREYL